MKIRKFYTIVEDIVMDGGKKIEKTHTRVATAVVIENPFAGEYVEDLNTHSLVATQSWRTIGCINQIKGGFTMNKNEGTQQAQASAILNEEYEYAFEAVPEEKKKGGLSLFVVLAGYPIALSNFVTGAVIGINMTFMEAMIAILAADAFLIFVAVMTGLVSYETGLSTSFLSRTVFGKKGSSIFSVLLALSAINWIGINGNTFATMIQTNFPSWPIPVSITGIIVILLWGQSAIRGYKGLEVISFIGVPELAKRVSCGFII